MEGDRYRSYLSVCRGLGTDLKVPGMSYTSDQVREAEARIRRECPGAHIAHTDYGFSLSVAKADKSMAYVVFQAPRDDRGRGEIIGDLDKIIAKLNTAAAA